MNFSRATHLHNLWNVARIYFSNVTYLFTQKMALVVMSWDRLVASGSYLVLWPNSNQISYTAAQLVAMRSRFYSVVMVVFRLLRFSWISRLEVIAKITIICEMVDIFNLFHWKRNSQVMETNTILIQPWSSLRVVVRTIISIKGFIRFSQFKESWSHSTCEENNNWKLIISICLYEP